MRCQPLPGGTVLQKTTLVLGAVLLCGAVGEAQTKLHLPSQAARASSVAIIADLLTTISGNTAFVTAGKARIGSQSYTLSDSTCVFGGAAGDIKIYVSDTGNLHCMAELGVTGSVTGSALFGTLTTVSYPPGSIPLADLTWSGTALSVDSDDRAFLSNRSVTAGTGITVTDVMGVVSVGVDVATTPLLAGANNWLGNNDFSAATRTVPARSVASDPATCTIGEQIFNTTSNQRKDCTAVNTWTVVGSGGGGGGGASFEKFFGGICQTTVGGFALSLPSTNAPAMNCSAVNANVPAWGTLDFDDTVSRSAFGTFPIPETSVPPINLKFGVSSAFTSQAFRVRISTACVNSGGTPDPVFNAAQIINLTSSATANFETVHLLSSLTTTGCAAGSRLVFRFDRDITDTSAATVRVHFLKFYQ